MNDTQLRAIVTAAGKQHDSLVAQLLRVLLGLWLPLAWLNRPDLVDAWAAESAVKVDIALEQSRRISRAAMIQQLRLLDALPPQMPTTGPIYPRSDTPITEVYKRPAKQYEYAIRKGKTPEEAWDAFTQRATQLVQADMAAARRDERSAIRAAAPKVVGYRRILHPELSKYGPCGLCIVAADRFYPTGYLNPLHNGCVCDEAEITEAFDPGNRLNKADLDRLYDAAGSNLREDLQRIRVTVRENGELGPILVRDGDNFTDWAAANRRSKEAAREFTPYQQPTTESDSDTWADLRASAERSIAMLESSRADRPRRSATPQSEAERLERIDLAISYHRDLIARAHVHRA